MTLNITNSGLKFSYYTSLWKLVLIINFSSEYFQPTTLVAAQQYNRNRAALAAGLVVGAYALNKKSVQAKSAEEAAENAEKPENKEKFKTKKLKEYENRIRQYSNPDRIFRYFATVATVYPDGKREDIYMTPDDFVRSLTIDGELQPQDCLIDKYRTVKTAEVSNFCFMTSSVEYWRHA